MNKTKLTYFEQEDILHLGNVSVTGGDAVILEESFFNSASCLITKRMLLA